MPVLKSVNKDFFKKWTRDMAYVLGFFLADGNMVISRRNGRFLSFYSADEEILIEIKKSLESDHKLSRRARDNSFRFQIGSKSMFNDLCVLGVTPNKSKRMRIPKVPKRFIGDFVRGYFDGDGNVWSGYVNRARSKPTRTIQAAFTSSCEDFLRGLLLTLKEEGLNGGSIFKIKDKQCHRLLFSTTDTLKLYKIMYNVPHRSYLKRKRLVFEKFIKMRP